jgi:hypothetical protein
VPSQSLSASLTTTVSGGAILRAAWPKELPGDPYIEFWHRLDAAGDIGTIEVR